MKTIDRASPFFTVAAVGATRRITPEGFLICEGVPIARLGTQIYTTSELNGLKGDAFGRIEVLRTADELFRPETIASFEGKAITIIHPWKEFVTPKNWEKYSVGTAHNVRRGTNDQADLLLADFMITKAGAIEYVNNELPQVSPGYDADYQQVIPGKAVQLNIIGNHIALVKTGRGGPRCSVTDGDTPMPKKSNFASRFMRALKAVGTNDEAGLQEVLEEQDDADAAERVQELETQLAAANAENATLKQEATARQTTDAAAAAETARQAQEAQAAQDQANAALFAGESLTGIKSRAEILAPGIAIPTTDSVDVAAGTELLRKALTAAVATTDGAECVAPFLMGRELAKITAPAELLGVFNGAAELKKVHNNRRTTLPSAKTKDFGKVVTPAEMNKAAEAFWANKQG